ncbi:MAG: hypothetical protein JJU03_04500 [Idiomarina sp.]|nr:hypothetical protein [Idiomarina sp.]
MKTNNANSNNTEQKAELIWEAPTVCSLKAQQTESKSNLGSREADAYGKYYHPS